MSGSFHVAPHTAEPPRTTRRRWVIALALSIALNEVAIGFLRLPAPEPPRDLDFVPRKVVLERRPTPAPTARPTPRPTPRPVVRLKPRPTIAPVPHAPAAKAAGTPAPTHGGAPAKPTHHFKNFDVYQQLAKNHLGRAAGIRGTGPGTGAGVALSGGAAGTGAGSGTTGAGTDSVNATAPCGEVIFNVRGAPEYHGGAADERITATVQFPDGHTETDTFPYTWTYANGERDDPWSSTNLAKQNFDIPLIFPPVGADTRAYPPLIRYILDHTRPNGTTVLQPCPNQTPLPAH